MRSRVPRLARAAGGVTGRPQPTAVSVSGASPASPSVSASASSPAVEGRAAASLASAASSARDTGSGSSGTRAAGGSGSLVKWAMRIAGTVWPENGGAPVNSS